MDFSLLPLGALSDSLARGDTTAGEALDASLARIAAHDEAVHAFLRLDAAKAKEDARRSDERRESNQLLSPLDGIAIGLKDIFCQRGVETTCGSKILAGWKAPYSAHVVEKLEGAGAVLLGKLNMDEFAMGSSTENHSAFGPTRNPWALERTPRADRRAGSAAAVAARFLPGALGTDTGGSIRQPAALVGCVGMKPTYGRVSRYGVIAFASSLDQVGPLAQDVRGAAILLQSIAGKDERDQTSSSRAVPDFISACAREVRGLRIGVPAEFFGEGSRRRSRTCRSRKVIARFEKLGCTIKPNLAPGRAQSHRDVTNIVSHRPKPQSNLSPL